MTNRLQMFRGDTPEYKVTARNREDGSEASLTGLVVRFTAKYRQSDPDESAVIAVSTLDGGIVVDPFNTFICRVTVPSAATSGMGRETELAFDVQVSDDLGHVETIVDGVLTVKMDLSRISP